MEKADRDAYFLGQILFNLLTLENNVRNGMAKRKGYSFPHINDLEVGYCLRNVPDVLKLNYFGDVIKEYNKIADEESKIEEGIISLRNNISHGMVLLKYPNFHSVATLYKYKKSRASDNDLLLETCEALTDDWLKKTLDFTLEALVKSSKFFNKK